MLEDRKAKIQDEENDEITSNKTIMEHALERAQEEVRPKEITRKMNHVRIWKKSILPCEIVEINGNNASACGDKDGEYSLMQWKFKIPKVENPNKNCFRKWRPFVAWLRNQEVITKINFGKYYIRKWQTSSNNMRLQIAGIDGTEQCRVRNENNQRVIEFGTRIENVEIKTGLLLWA